MRKIGFKLINNERGVTLLELIAALLLASLVVGILMTSFSIGAKHNVSASDTLRVQQEANLVIAKISAKHRSGECYNLKETGGKLFFVSYKTGTAIPCSEELTVEAVSDSSYEYKVNTNGFLGNPKKCDLKLELTVKSGTREVVLNSTISRIKTEGACGP
ncbi:prepilin-type N-terminal cleavage/methylation domain-containing protein [Planococcus sp. APC 3906]|uniref:prepilin-type N-terminal cleavage/methylation domain-containing protein n=1 Tax=Planococcus sp. APC 3906 TaxID=3035194 RepID=UPI0025B2D513|nr:prepilin-type N-terminal cleavage/methylation domain-containing protein [Planococcus sp. APC 3906]MDN3449119.1 prepilin-type N-terminal cleavage/methylation domain-containing protein [Planococcus sp. APC 3906]